MSENPRRRYRVRLRRAVAGSFLAAASAAALAGMTAAPALAVTTSSISAAAEAGAYACHEPDASSSVDLVAAASSTAGSPTAAERLAGVRSDLDRAVLLRLVTTEQADGFYAQIQRRIAGGL